MVIEEFNITEPSCGTFELEFTTPDYSPENIHGYGGPNDKKSNISEIGVTVQLNKQEAYTFRKRHNPTVDGPFIFSIQEIIAGKKASGQVTNNDMISGCDGCGTVRVYHGKEDTYQSGCITVMLTTYKEVITLGEARDLAVIGQGIKKIRSVCQEIKRITDLVAKYTWPTGHRSYKETVSTERQRMKTITNLDIARAKLEMLAGSDPDFDCDCVDDIVKEINYYIDDVESI